ncbi:coiled-coil domain-containing protein 120 isoform X2 [Monodelphis domestica]|uniref:coiled-coil domain-containing protein 120 isoform X2 n=1 Tax=Monodelphis domestica TaxID=13616 RepID=UPI0024E1FE72|nr:coiled-coil domain-containing protein 120 isoform X2 [Monodelphis domestica]
MEVRGQLISSPSYNCPALPLEETPPAKVERLRVLLERHRGLQETLTLKLRELRRVCLLEAELTGRLPAEYPLEPGEQPHPIRRRAAPVPLPPWGLCPSGVLALESLEREVSVQRQIATAARRLALAPELSLEQQRRRRQVQADASQRLLDLEEQLRASRAHLGLPLTLLPGQTQPPPGHGGPSLPGLRTRVAQLSQDDASRSESSSLSESASHENEDSHSERPSLPKARDQLRVSVSAGGSPERRPAWKATPPPPVVELYGDPKSRRNSVASPTSPTRTLPRSISSFEGRSVPATPVLARGPAAQLCRLEGLHSRQWSGSQDSQMGFPHTDGPWERAFLLSGRTRRSNSSEALLVDRSTGISGFACARLPPEGPPASPPCQSNESIFERPAPMPPLAFSSRTAGPPDLPRAARPSSAAPPAPRGRPLPAYSDLLLDYYLARGGQCWTEGPSHLSHRDGLFVVFPPAPSALHGNGGGGIGSPLLRAKDLAPHGGPGRGLTSRTKSDDGGPLPGSFWAGPGPTRYHSQPDQADLRGGHKALALEGLRDWYIRNVGSTGGGAMTGLHPSARGFFPEGQALHPSPFSLHHSSSPQGLLLHTAHGHEAGPEPYLGYAGVALPSVAAAAALPHSLSFTAPPASGRHYADFLYPPELSSHLSDLALEGDRPLDSDPRTPGTLV